MHVDVCVGCVGVVFLARVPCCCDGGGGVGLGLLVENWIVDASIFCDVLLRMLCVSSGWRGSFFLFCGGFFGWGVCVVCVVASYEGHMVDALASRADEGRGSLR